MDTTLILDPEDQRWTQVSPLPIPLCCARVVPTVHSFLVVGGESAEFTDRIFEFDSVNMDWIQRNETLDIARSDFFCHGFGEGKVCARGLNM